MSKKKKGPQFDSDTGPTLVASVSAPVPTAPAKGKAPASPQKPLLIAAGGAAAAAAGAGLLVLLVLLPVGTANHLKEIAGAHASGAAAALQQQLDGRQSQVNAMAMDPAAVAALQSGDAEQVNTELALLKTRLPGSNRVLLLPLDATSSSHLATGAEGLRNNIEVDLVRRAFKRADATPELYRINDQWVLSQAAPVAATPDGAPAGVLLASFDTAPLKTTLEKMAGSEGSLELYQEFKAGEPTSVLTVGSGGGRGQGEASLYAFWRVRFTPSAGMASAISSIPVLGWLFALAGALAAAACAFVGQRLLLGQVNKEILAVNDFLTAVAERPNTDMPTVTLRALTDLAGHLSEQMRQLRIKAETARPAASAAPAKAGSAAAAEAPQSVDPLFQDMEIVDLDSLDDLEGSLMLEDSGSFLDAGFSTDNAPIAAEIFRAYDIRGIAEKQLSASAAYRIGRGVASEAQAHGQTTVCVGRDGRLSSPMLRDNLVRGITESGCDVIDIGIVPSPVLYFSTYHLKTGTGVMITGSHNPAEYNGMKIMIAGKTIAGDRIQELRQRIEAAEFTTGSGKVTEVSVSDDYIKRIAGDVAVAQPLKVVVDAGNGAAGEIAPRLLRELGCEVIPIFCDIDGTFPNHHPDPSEAKNLADLMAAVHEHGADLGVAFDGDGDRIGVVTATGHMVMPDRLLMLFAQDIVARNPGADIIFDIKCTRQLAQVISNYGGRPIMWRSGHSHIKEKMVETGALLGGELSGHIFFKERWYGFDDGIYSAARLIEILSTSSADLDHQLSAFPESLSTPEMKITVNEDEKFDIIDKLAIIGQFDGGKVSTIDGVRVDFDDGWGLVRASNTTPCLTLRFEADNDVALQRIQTMFREQLSAVDAGLGF